MKRKISGACVKFLFLYKIWDEQDFLFLGGTIGLLIVLRFIRVDSFGSTYSRQLMVFSQIIRIR